MVVLTKGLRKQAWMHIERVDIEQNHEIKFVGLMIDYISKNAGNLTLVFFGLNGPKVILSYHPF